MRSTRPAVRSSPLVVAGAILAATLAACSTGDGRTLDPPVFPPPATTLPPATTPVTEPPVVVAPLGLVAPWRDGAPVPVRYTCEGEDLSPALTWTGVAGDAVELAVTVTDLDAPGFVHWIVFGISPDVTGLAEGTVPDGADVWPNGSGTTDYTGPCPPAGEEHRYSYTLHALNQQLEPADGASAIEIVEQLNLISIDQSSVSGTFARSG